MAPVVAEAIAKIRNLTADARRIAQWYEINPERLYLPQNFEYLRSQELLTLDEIQRAILLEEGASSFARLWCSANNVLLNKRGNRVYARFADVERAAIALLPAGFPLLNAEVNLKFSEALIVVRRNELHSAKVHFAVSLSLSTSTRSIQHSEREASMVLSRYLIALASPSQTAVQSEFLLTSSVTT